MDDDGLYRDLDIGIFFTMADGKKDKDKEMKDPKPRQGEKSLNNSSNVTSLQVWLGNTNNTVSNSEDKSDEETAHRNKRKRL